MKLFVLAVGNKMPEWVNMACSDYLKRFGRDFEISLKEIKPEKRTPQYNKEQILAIEEIRIREQIPRQSNIVILDEKGISLNTPELTTLLTQWQNQNIQPCFVIGGADGISTSLKKEGILSLQLSRFTLPHALARILLIEQIYRAVSIIKHHPYHRI